MAIKDLAKVQKLVFICNGGTCSNNAGTADNTAELRKHITANKLDDDIHTVRTKCMGQCDKGPIMFIHPEGVWYGKVNPEFTREIVTKHFMEDALLTDNIVFPEQTIHI